MMKRGRGRPRKIHAHYSAEEIVNFSNGKVSYSNRLPEFFKIYTPALSSQMLRIPPDFMEKFNGNIPTTCTMKRRRGVSKWQVEINRMNDCWFFQKGWPHFVEDNSLRDGDFLTFCYLGKSVFSVKIFSPNGCAKGADDDDQTSPSEMNESEQQKISRWGSSMAYIDGNPCFSIVIHKSHVNKGVLSIPKEFWKAHMQKNIIKEASLWVESEEWSVEVASYDGSRALFQRGCPKFLKDNSLKVGTLCTFLLVDAINLYFKVTFHR